MSWIFNLSNEKAATFKDTGIMLLILCMLVFLFHNETQLCLIRSGCYMSSMKGSLFYLYQADKLLHTLMATDNEQHTYSCDEGKQS